VTFLGAIAVGLFATPSYPQMTEIRLAVETSTPIMGAEEFPALAQFNGFSFRRNCLRRSVPADLTLAQSLQSNLNMIAFEINTRSPKQRSISPALEIRIHFADGSKETFVQPDAEISESILQQINPSHLSTQSRIVVADDYSKSVFVCSQINRIDFVHDGDGFAHIPDDHADLVELTEAEFHRRVPLNNPSRLDKRVQQRRLNDLQVSFLNLRMRGGSHVYLMNETAVKLTAESQSYMQRLLSKGALAVRLQGGGQSFLNLANLIGYTVYPGVAEVPADTWMAQPKATYEAVS